MVNLKFLQIVVKSAWQGTKVQAKGHEVYFLYFEIYRGRTPILGKKTVK